MLVLALFCFCAASHGAWGGDLSYGQKKILYQAQKALSVGDPGQCARIIGQYGRENKNRLPARFSDLLGTCLYQTGAYADAAKAFECALEDQPGKSDLLQKLATCHYQAGSFVSAGKDFTAAFDACADDAVPDPELLYHAAVSFYQGKNMASAARCLERLFSLVQKREKSWNELLLSCYLELKAWKKAHALIDTLLKDAPANESYWRLLTQVYLQQERYLEAAGAMEIRFKLKPPTREEMNNLAGLYRYLNLPLRAARVVRQMAGDAPGPEDIERLAGLYMQGYDLSCALETVEQGLAKGYDVPRLKVLHTRLMYEQGRYKALLAASGKQADLLPEQILIQGYAAWHLGRWQSACTFFNRAKAFAKVRGQAENALDVLTTLLKSAETARDDDAPAADYLATP
jgi:tetratricopeptide (TPR) repeat protein